MDRIKALLKELRQRSDCEFMPPCGLPAIFSGLKLCDDLAVFYDECGGAELFKGQQWPIHINTPSEFCHANTNIRQTLGENDRSYTWYLVAKSFMEQISIDLGHQRPGWCYDSFWDCHAIAGSCRVIAKSFTDFLARCAELEGRERYWCGPQFASYGDAYDE